MVGEVERIKIIGENVDTYRQIVNTGPSSVGVRH
jgi:hypothetical protein